jgi:glycosyltransferase involved in cell wall biosynthesis
MNVLFLARRFSPHIGGVEKHLNEVLPHLSNHNITVITEQYDSYLPLDEDINGVRVLRIPLPDGETSKLHIWKWVILHEGLFLKADIIHVHDVFFWVLPLRFLLCWKKYFITFHGYEGTNPTLKQIFWHRFAAKLTRASIGIGAFHQKWYGVQPTITSFGGVKVLPTSRKKSSGAIFVGRLDADTGIREYIAASKDSHLDVYGDGPLREQLEDMVKKRKLPVKFFGQIVDPSLLYSNYAVVCVSGYLTILEALANGLPVISTYQTEIKKDYLEMSPFAQWIVITNSVAEISSTLKKPNIKNVAVAQNWARSQTWQLLATHYEKLWQK